MRGDREGEPSRLVAGISTMSIPVALIPYGGCIRVGPLVLSMSLSRAPALLSPLPRQHPQHWCATDHLAPRPTLLYPRLSLGYSGGAVGVGQASRS